MAIVWYEHFDLYGTNTANLSAAGYSVASGWTFDSANANTPPYCLRSGLRNQSLNRVLDAPINTWVLGLAIRPTSGTEPSERGFGPGAYFRVAYNNELGLSVYNAATDGLLIAKTAPNIFQLNTWTYIECKAESNRLELRKEGQTILVINGMTNGPFSNMYIGSNKSGSLNTGYPHIDDVYLDDSDFLGPRRVVTLMPNSDGTFQQWVPTPGPDGWSAIDDRTPNDADFIASETIGDISDFGHEELTYRISNIAALALESRNIKTDAGDAGFRMGIESNGNVINSPEILPGTGWGISRALFPLNPDGNQPWTKEALDDANLRVERTS